MAGGQSQHSISTPQSSQRPQLAPVETSSPSTKAFAPGLASASANNTPSTVVSSALYTPRSSFIQSDKASVHTHYDWPIRYQDTLPQAIAPERLNAAGSAHVQADVADVSAKRSGSELSSSSCTGDDIFSEVSVSRSSTCETDVEVDGSQSNAVQSAQISTSPPKMSVPTKKMPISTHLRRRAIEISSEQLLQRLQAAYQSHESHIPLHKVTASGSAIIDGDSQCYTSQQSEVNFRVQAHSANPAPSSFESNIDTASTNSTDLDTAAPATHTPNHGAVSLGSAPAGRPSSQSVDDLVTSLADIAVASEANLAGTFDSYSFVPPLVLDLRPVELFTGELQLPTKVTDAAGHVRGSVNLLIPGLILRRWAKSARHQQATPSLRAFISTPMSKRNFSEIVSTASHARLSCLDRSFRSSAAGSAALASQSASDMTLSTSHDTEIHDQYWQSDIIVLCDEEGLQDAGTTSGKLPTSTALIETLEKTPPVGEASSPADRGGGLYFVRSSMASLKAVLGPSLWCTEVSMQETPSEVGCASSAQDVRERPPKHAPSFPISTGVRAVSPARDERKSLQTHESEPEIPILRNHESFAAGGLPRLARLKSSESLSSQVNMKRSASTRRSPAGLKLQVNTGIPKRSSTLSSFPADGGLAGAQIPTTPASMQSLQHLCRQQAQQPPSRATFGDMCLAPGSRGTFTFSEHGQRLTSSGSDTTPKPTASLVSQIEISTILPDFLYLGPALQTQTDLADLQRRGVRRVLNMAAEIDDVGPLQLEQNFDRYLKVPMLDSVEALGVQDSIRDACDFLDDARLRSEPVYVHCRAGKSRSVTVVIAYLIHAFRWPLNRAYSHVVERRSAICPNIGFVAELMKYEEHELSVARSGGIVAPGSVPSSAQAVNFANLDDASRSMPSLHKAMTPTLVSPEASVSDALLCKSTPNLAGLAD